MEGSPRKCCLVQLLLLRRLDGIGGQETARWASRMTLLCSVSTCNDAEQFPGLSQTAFFSSPSLRVIDCRRQVRAFFAASGDEVRRFGDGIRLCLQPLSTTARAAGSNGGTGGGVVHRVDSATSTVFRQSPGGRVGAGWALVVEGPILLASEETKPCFAQTYGLPGRDPQERVDYFTCGQCRVNWVCASCATHCHRACEGVRPFAMNHLPSWGCCYCMKRRAKTRCKLAAQGGGAAAREEVA